jgi:DNA-directed RNA polymerase I subunit RPA43
MATDDKKRKHKNDKKEKKEHKKHKSSSTIVETKRRHSSIHTATLPGTSSSFSEVIIKLYIHLAPMWSSKPMDGVNEILNAFLMK